MLCYDLENFLTKRKNYFANPCKYYIFADE